MRLDINLASLPYEDSTRFWKIWGTAVSAAVLFTLILLTLTIRGWIDASRDRTAMARTRAMITDRDRVRAAAEETLNRQENRSTRDESQFLNELIERKAFSWTRVLENLEKVMPNRVHLMSISPGLDEDNQLFLKMTIAGESRDRAIELVRRMEDSHRFSQVAIISERATQANNGDTYQFDIQAIYLPESPKSDLKVAENTNPAETKPPETKSKTETKPKSGGKPGAKLPGSKG